MTTEDISRAVEDLFGGIQFTSKPEGLYDPLRYMISIGGKRIRPRPPFTPMARNSTTTRFVFAPLRTAVM